VKNLLFLFILKLCFFNNSQVFASGSRESKFQLDIDIQYNENNKLTKLNKNNDYCVGAWIISWPKEVFENNYIIISNYYEFLNMLNPRFDFIPTITPEYFNDNVLIFIIVAFGHGTYIPKNERFFENAHNRCSFMVDLKRRWGRQADHYDYGIYMVEMKKS
jgi:hypothetical protein